MERLQFFVNDNFNMLAYLYDIKSQNNLAAVTQAEIADALCLSRATTNKIIKSLKDAGYIQIDGAHIGRYLLTDSAIRAVELLRKL